MAQAVVTQAIKNLGEHAKLATLAFDRGFIDGRLCGDWMVRASHSTFQLKRIWRSIPMHAPLLNPASVR